MEARANKVRRRSIRKARKQTRDRIRRNVRRKVAEMAFGRTHFGAAVLGDKRRTDRLVKMADTIAMHPGGTLPDKFKNPAELEAVYRLMNNEAVTHEAVIASHCALTRQRMAEESGVVLVLHDTTELQYTTLKSIKDLGPVGNGLDRGYLCHNSLAVVPGTRQVLGLASQILHTRRKVPAKETAQQKREHPDRESRLWKRGCEAVGPAAPGKRVVDIFDAGADAFELLDHEHANNRLYVLRAGKDRLLGGENAEQIEQVKRKLYEHVRGLADLGGRYVTIRANINKRNGKKLKKKQTARDAKVRIAAGPITLGVPSITRGEHGQESLGLWALIVSEVNAPEGVEPVEWILLTNVPVNSLEEAAERVDWYACRPIVEEFHKAQKTGCGIENPQFTSKAALEPIIGILSVAAVMLLDLRHQARRPDADKVRATTVMPRLYVRVLSAWRWGKPKINMSIYDCFMALGRLGGHQNRKSDGPPGWLTLWRGWNDLHLMVMGARAAGLEKM